MRFLAETGLLTCLIACHGASSAVSPDAVISDVVDGNVEVHLTVDVAQPGPVGGLVAAGRIFNGSIWNPLDAAPMFEPHVLAAGHRLGGTRFSLQRLMNGPALDRAAFTAQLPAALAAIPELAMLGRYQQHGSEIIFNFMGVPTWLGNPAVPAPTGCDPVQVYWRPPNNAATYATEVVAPIAAYLTQRFGPGQHYEVGNEPTSCTWWGTTAQYLDYYAATVHGILSVDPTAVIGGPEHATDVGYAGTLADTDHDPTPFLRRFLAYAASYPSGRLPVDFVTLHSYGVNPASNAHYHADQLAIVRGWLGELGYPSSTRLLNTEWFYQAYVPVSAEDNVNTSHVGAGYIGVSMLAFDEAGYDNLCSQNYQDEGDGTGLDVVSPMFAAIRGVPRSGYFIFDMMSQLTGTRLSASSDHPWVRTAAFDAAGTTNVFVASFVPTEDMSRLAVAASILRADPSLVTVLGPFAGQVEAYLTGAAADLAPEVAAALTEAQRGILADGRALFAQERANRAAWAVGPRTEDAQVRPGKPLTWQLEVAGRSSLPSRVIDARIDSQHVVDAAKVKALYEELFAAALPIACSSEQAIRTDLGVTHGCPAIDAFCASGGTSTAGLDVDPECKIFETYVVEISTRATFTHTQQLLDQGNASSTIQQAFHDRSASALASYRVVYDQLYTRADVRPFETDVTDQVRVDHGRLIVALPGEPFSVHLVRIEP